MRFSKMIRTIDTHTGGQPTRTVLGGLPKIPGENMIEKFIYFRDNLDYIRTFLMYEPRGNEVMSGAIITEPTHPEADIGVIYIEVGGCLPMCGHDTIGLATALVEIGFVEVKEPVTEIKFDTPVGIVMARVEVKDNSAKSVTFRNVPSFLLAQEVTLEVPDLGKIKVDVGYGGDFYTIVKAEDVGITIDPKEAAKIIAMGTRINDCVDEQLQIQHPTKKFINQCTHVQFSAPPTSRGVNLKNAVVFRPGSIDRSPCGTGTSAKAASLYFRGQLKTGEPFVHESIIGSKFTAKIVEETKVGDIKAVIPEITGTAHVMGFNNFVLDPDDPLKEGFLLGK